jgi:hypothetical protein
MKKTIITHFYNEEYLLPWWLNHHKKYFDHGVLINYASTDKSVEIIKELCPTWEIVESKNKDFGASDVDREVLDIEANIDGWKICLNTTEFLIGDFNSLDLTKQEELYIPCLYFIDELESRDSNTLNYNINLWDILKTGLDVPNTMEHRGSRLMHSNHVRYSHGRHYRRLINTERFIIFNYGFAPMTEEFIARKLQIQSRVPYSDRISQCGGQHTDNNSAEGLTREKLIYMFNEYINENSVSYEYLKTSFKNHGRLLLKQDLTNLMNRYLSLLS